MKRDLIYPELSYKLIVIAFKVYNKLGYGHKEKYFQRAYASELKREGLEYVIEKSLKLYYGEDLIGAYILDFVIDNKIILELKITKSFKKVHMGQTLRYLRAVDLKLAIIIYFTPSGVYYRRVINPDKNI